MMGRLLALEAVGLVVLLAVASMIVYGLSGRARDADASRKGSRFLLGMGDFLVHWFLWVLRPLDRISERLALSPDFYNFAALGFGIASGLAIGSGHLQTGGWTLALGGICDIMDGRVARVRNLASPYGQFIDSTLDRFVEAFAFLGFAVFLRGFTWGPLVVAGAVSGSLLVSYARARGESLGVLCKEGLMQRAERMFLMVMACLLDRAVTGWLEEPRGWVVLWVLGVIGVATFVTAIQRTVWIALRLRKAAI